MSVTSLFAALAAAATLAGTAIAADPAPRSILVSHADLDLSRTADQDRLNARIGRAARTVCGVATADLRARQDMMECRTFAVANAQAQMTVLIAARASGTQVAQAGSALTVRAR